MPELRKDPITNRWVIIATERAKRPDDFKSSHDGLSEGECPFCEGNESHTPPEIFAIRNNKTSSNVPGWELRVVSSIGPLLHMNGKLNRHGNGLYDVMNGVGTHEVLIETPKHIANIANLEVGQVTKVISTYIQRLTDLEKDARFKYVLIFKNYHWKAGGGRIKHSRSQLIATPVTPKRVKEELLGSRRYFDYHERCVFCDLIRQEIQTKERLILEIDGFIAVAPFASRFPFEVWILPKRHSPDFSKCAIEDREKLGHILKLVLLKLEKRLNDPPYNYIIHTAPFRRPKVGYWKTIEEDYHWHIEIIPRLTRIAGFEWGTGFYICPLQPEQAAKFLREAKI